MSSESDLPLCNPLWKRTAEMIIIIRVRDRLEFGAGETQNATLRPQNCHKWQIWANSPSGGQKCATAKENVLISFRFDKNMELPHYNFLFLSMSSSRVSKNVTFTDNWKKQPWKCLQNAKVKVWKEATFVLKQEAKVQGGVDYLLSPVNSRMWLSFNKWKSIDLYVWERWFSFSWFNQN